MANDEVYRALADLTEHEARILTGIWGCGQQHGYSETTVPARKIQPLSARGKALIAKGLLAHKPTNRVGPTDLGWRVVMELDHLYDALDAAREVPVLRQNQRYDIAAFYKACDTLGLT